MPRPNNARDGANPLNDGMVERQPHGALRGRPEG
jgi:hypothetical protein